MKKKKILFIIWSYTCGGGAESLLTTIVNHLNPEKYDISIIEYEHSEFKKEPANEYVHVLPPIEKIDIPEKTKKGYQVYHTPEILIDRYIKGDYELYVSFNYQIPTFLLPEGTRNIAWINETINDLGKETAKREWNLQDKAFDKVSHIVSTSPLSTLSLQELFPRHQDKIIELINGLDIESVREKSLKHATVKLEQPSIVFLGRLDENKDPVRLLQILLLVHQKQPSVHLYFVGEGSLKEQIILLSKKYGIDGFVHLLGYQDNPFPIVRQCNLCCVLSKSEGFLLSLMECVALGKPFVATDVGGMNVLSNNQRCGKLIETDEEAAEAILQLLECDPYEMELECEKSIKRFALKDYIGKMETLFDSICSGKGE